jgi:D-glucosaminate-6-phosphate ammonia-lyase
MAALLEEHSLTEVINAGGTLTTIGSSSVPPEVVRAVSDILPRFVRILDLQGVAAGVIRNVFGAESGCVTACSAAGIAVCTAACMTGANLANVEQLPDTAGMKDEIILQHGHDVFFESSVKQMIRLTGARVRLIGTSSRVGRYHLEAAISERTAGAAYVFSAHSPKHGLVPLDQFSEIAHAKGVPVFVDAAAQRDPRALLEMGADLVIVSGHKMMAGPTSGIIAGRKDLIRACLGNQLHGVGRAMKASKETIVGAVAAMERWARLDQRAEDDRRRGVLEQFLEALGGVPGLDVSIQPRAGVDPVERAKVVVEANVVGLSAYEICVQLADGRPPIVVRGHNAIDEGSLLIDPINLSEASAETVARAIRDLVELPDDEKRRIRSGSPRWPNRADASATALVQDWDL